MKRIMITGASGFLGSRLAHYYKNRYELLLPTHEELNISREEAVNVYGQHKLEAEQRALGNNPDAIGLRLTWMYDLPNCPMKLNSNILVNLQKASD